MDAVQRYGWKDVKSIAQHVGTRTPTQVRTHAQKLFLRQQKEQTGARVWLGLGLGSGIGLGSGLGLAARLPRGVDGLGNSNPSARRQREHASPPPP